MDTEPDFSIITPSYNYARYVRECIESVKTQDGMSQVRQMHAYLVHASRFRNAPDQRQGAPACIPCPFFPENGSACFSGWVHGLFDPYAAFRDFPLS